MIKDSADEKKIIYGRIDLILCQIEMKDYLDK